MRGLVSTNEYAIFGSLMDKLNEVLPSVTSAAVRAETAASSAETAAESINVNGVNITTGSILTPGTSSSIIDKTGTNTFELHAPVVKPSVTASVSLEKDATPSILVTTASVTPASGEDSNLLVNFDLAFTLPKNTIDIALSTTFEPEDSGKAGDAAAIGSAIEAATTNIPLTALENDYVIPITHGGTGVAASDTTDTATVLAGLGAQPRIKSAKMSLFADAWPTESAIINSDTYNVYTYNQTIDVTDPAVANPPFTITSTSQFIATPFTLFGWNQARECGLYPPRVLADNQITFAADTRPDGIINIQIYYW